MSDYLQGWSEPASDPIQQPKYGRTPHETLKRLMKLKGFKRDDVLVQAPQRDPFYAGTPSQQQKARWFAGVWDRLTASRHLRAAHYLLVHHTEDPRRHDGLPYRNTEEDWEYLEDASRFARYLGYVDPAQVIDRRNTDEAIFAEPYAPEQPRWEYELGEWEAPWIPPTPVGGRGWELPGLEAHGYDYSPGLQAFHVEVWIEKSTMDGILRPLCERHGVDLITGIGQMSITKVEQLLYRVARMDKPARILYIADHDPGGESMPVQVARKVEFALHQRKSAADIKLDPLALTPEQVREYDLPRTPIKEKDLSKEGFERKHGAGATELDALEALYPGELRRIVDDAIRQFRDYSLPTRIGEAEQEAAAVLRWYEERLRNTHAAELNRIRRQVRVIKESYRQPLARLNEEFQADIRPLMEDLEALRLTVAEDVEGMAPEIPELPEPQTPTERDGALFDSTRGFLEQLESYKRRQNRGADEAG